MSDKAGLSMHHLPAAAKQVTLLGRTRCYGMSPTALQSLHAMMCAGQCILGSGYFGWGGSRLLQDTGGGHANSSNVQLCRVHASPAGC